MNPTQIAVVKQFIPNSSYRFDFWKVRTFEQGCPRCEVDFVMCELIQQNLQRTRNAFGVGFPNFSHSPFV